MSFGHDHGHSHPAADPRAERTTRRLRYALEINFVFLIVEAAGGWYTNSLALLSDAGHMLTDVAALALALFARWLAARPASAQRSFGYRRAEILAAFLNALALWAIVAGILWEAVQRVRAPEAVGSGLMTVIALLGLAANAVSAWMLAGEHGDMNVRGAFLHLMADVLGSVGALVAGLVMLFGGNPIVDPLASILIAGLVFWGSLGLMRQSVDVLMEAAPAHVDVGAVTRALAAVAGVAEVHDLHVWQIGSGLVSLSGHLVVGNDADRDVVLLQAQRMLRGDFAIEHATLQIETAALHRFLTTAETTINFERKRPPRADA